MKPKKFDCVKMKNDIQQRLMKEFEGLSYEEQWAITEKRILSDPILGPFWKKAKPVAVVASTPERGTEDHMREGKRSH
jgi:hypothetical protein